MEFSKKLLYMIFAAASVVILFSMYMVWETKDLTPLSYLIPAVFVEVGTATGFYYWKAKAENIKKIGMSKDDEEEII